MTKKMAQRCSSTAVPGAAEVQGSGSALCFREHKHHVTTAAFAQGQNQNNKKFNQDHTLSSPAQGYACVLIPCSGAPLVLSALPPHPGLVMAPECFIQAQCQQTHPNQAVTSTSHYRLEPMIPLISTAIKKQSEINPVIKNIYSVSLLFLWPLSPSKASRRHPLARHHMGSPQPTKLPLEGNWLEKGNILQSLKFRFVLHWMSYVSKAP